MTRPRRPRRGRQQNRLRRRDPPSPSPVRASALGRRSPRCLGGGRGGIRRKLRPRVGGCFGKRRWDHEHTQSGQARGKDFESSHRFLLAQLARLPLGNCSHDVVGTEPSFFSEGRVSTLVRPAEGTRPEVSARVPSPPRGDLRAHEAAAVRDQSVERLPGSPGSVRECPSGEESVPGADHQPHHDEPLRRRTRPRRPGVAGPGRSRPPAPTRRPHRQR